MLVYGLVLLIVLLARIAACTGFLFNNAAHSYEPSSLAMKGVICVKVVSQNHDS